MNDKIWDWLHGIIARPVPTIKEIVEEAPVLWGLLVYTGVSLLTSVGSLLAEGGHAAVNEALAEFGLEIAPAFTALITVGMLVFSLVALVVSTLLLHLLSLLFRGQGRFRGLLAAVSFAYFPLIFTLPLILISTFLGIVGAIVGTLGGGAITLWVIVLDVIALRESHGLSTGISVLVYVIHLFVLVFIPVFLFFALMIFFLV